MAQPHFLLLLWRRCQLSLRYPVSEICWESDVLMHKGFLLGIGSSTLWVAAGFHNPNCIRNHFITILYQKNH